MIKKLIVLTISIFLLVQTASADITTGLIGYWKLNEASGSSAEDSVGTSTGTLSGGASFPATGQVDGGCSFDGVDGVIKMGDVLDIGDGQDFSMAGWFKRTGTTKDRIFGKRASVAAGAGYGIRIGSVANKLDFEIADTSGDGSDEYQLLSTSTFTDNALHHFVVVFDESSAANTTLYVDGSDDSPSKTGTIGDIGSLTNIVDFAIGAESDVGDPFNGILDEIRLYDRVLSSGDVTELFNFTEPFISTGRRPIIIY